MAIKFDEVSRTFYLDGKDITYAFLLMNMIMQSICIMEKP